MVESLLVCFPNLKERPVTDVCGSILTSCCHPALVTRVRTLLRRLHASVDEFHRNKDAKVLNFVGKHLTRVQGSCDPELFAFLLHLLRKIAVARPENLSLYAGAEKKHLASPNFIDQLDYLFWTLHRKIPKYPELASLDSICKFLFILLFV